MGGKLLMEYRKDTVTIESKYDCYDDLTTHLVSIEIPGKLPFAERFDRMIEAIKEYLEGNKSEFIQYYLEMSPFDLDSMPTPINLETLKFRLELIARSFDEYDSNDVEHLPLLKKYGMVTQPEYNI